MKRLLIFLLPLVVIFGCSRDSLDDQNVSLKRAKVPIPCKGTVCMTEKEGVERMPVWLPGTEIPVPGITLSREAWISGHLTLAGNLTEQSCMTGISAYLDMEAYAKGRIVLTADYTARLYAANGDYVDLFSPIEIEVIDDVKYITGTFTLLGGTGKCNVEGGGVLNGIVPCWDIKGEYLYPRD
jgi:hypothetical protein